MKKIKKIPWSESIWFLDLDDTLIDTAGATISASEGKLSDVANFLT
ncbi:hypothetical protein HYZ05_02585 [Candidatus Daviesbacteria bacterium]|nr:hypothetical protein [Candidatus Daviesbacteria bacterium]